MGVCLVVAQRGLSCCGSGRDRPGLVGDPRGRSQPSRRRRDGDRGDRDPLTPDYAGGSTGGSCSTNSPLSRRSRSGMKLRTGGTRSKLYGGGGDVVAHSSVLPCHGSSPAISPPCQLRTTLMRNSRTENAIRKDEIVMIRLVVPQPGLAYV